MRLVHFPPVPGPEEPDEYFIADRPWHYWIYDADSDTANRLCYFVAGVEVDEAFLVTILKHRVDCKPCLEILHS